MPQQIRWTGSSDPKEAVDRHRRWVARFRGVRSLLTLLTRCRRPHHGSLPFDVRLDEVRSRIMDEARLAFLAGARVHRVEHERIAASAGCLLAARAFFFRCAQVTADLRGTSEVRWECSGTGERTGFNMPATHVNSYYDEGELNFYPERLSFRHPIYACEVHAICWL